MLVSFLDPVCQDKLAEQYRVISLGCQPNANYSHVFPVVNETSGDEVIFETWLEAQESLCRQNFAFTSQIIHEALKTMRQFILARLKESFEHSEFVFKRLEKLFDFCPFLLFQSRVGNESWMFALIKTFFDVSSSHWSKLPETVKFSLPRTVMRGFLKLAPEKCPPALGEMIATLNGYLREGSSDVIQRLSCAFEESNSVHVLEIIFDSDFVVIFDGLRTESSLSIFNKAGLNSLLFLRFIMRLWSKNKIWYV
jgi:hypothetical protein